LAALFWSSCCAPQMWQQCTCCCEFGGAKAFRSVLTSCFKEHCFTRCAGLYQHPAVSIVCWHAAGMQDNIALDYVHAYAGQQQCSCTSAGMDCAGMACRHMCSSSSRTTHQPQHDYNTLGLQANSSYTAAARLDLQEDPTVCQPAYTSGFSK